MIYTEKPRKTITFGLIHTNNEIIDAIKSFALLHVITVFLNQSEKSIVSSEPYCGNIPGVFHPQAAASIATWPSPFLVVLCWSALRASNSISRSPSARASFRT